MVSKFPNSRTIHNLTFSENICAIPKIIATLLTVLKVLIPDSINRTSHSCAFGVEGFQNVGKIAKPLRFVSFRHQNLNRLNSEFIE